jgi:tRNA(Ile)-lysidine synthase
LWTKDAADQAAIDRFVKATNRLTASDSSKILLAVSGGPDSLALLLLAHEAMPQHIAAATVDHGLRSEARDEAEYVAEICRQRGISHQILQPEAPIIGNIQAAARAARYALLEAAADGLGCGHIATAHHADDQLETMLMRLARGSGVDGLAGIREHNGRIIRPVLAFTKTELARLCTSAGVEPVSDPSNDNADFDRVAMRQWLATAPNPLNPARAVRSASALADVTGALEWMTATLADERIGVCADEIQLKIKDLPFELQRRLLLNALRKITPDIEPRGDALERTLADLMAGNTVTLGNILCVGGMIWRLTPAPPRRSET